MSKLLLLVTLLINIHLVTCFCNCPNGFECSNEDSKQNSTCVPCIDGFTFSSNGTCKQCTTCLSGVEEHSCNQTDDSVCVDKCEREFYWNYETNSCEQCRLCPHGYGAIIPCGPTNDAICLQCPIGSFSDVLSSSAECVPCTVCKNEQFLTHNCTSIQDAVCNDKRNLYIRKSSITNSQEKNEETSVSFGEGLLPLYCTLLSAVIFGLILYVLIKKWLLSKQHNKLPLHDEQHQFQCKLLLQAKLYNAPKCKRTQVENLLNPYRCDKRDWIALARQFGFNSTQIAHLQKFRSSQGGCTRELLVQLDKNGVTVDEFVKGLLLIGRGDVASIFQPHLIKSVGRGFQVQLI